MRSHPPVTAVIKLCSQCKLLSQVAYLHFVSDCSNTFLKKVFSPLRLSKQSRGGHFLCISFVFHLARGCQRAPVTSFSSTGAQEPAIFPEKLYKLRQAYSINKSDSIILYQNSILVFNECNCQYKESRIMNHYFLLPSTF